MVHLTVTVHTSALKLAFKSHPIEASEDADTLKLPLDKFALVPETEVDSVKHPQGGVTTVCPEDRVFLGAGAGDHDNIIISPQKQ